MIDVSGCLWPKSVRGGTHGQCRFGESGSASRKTLAGTRPHACQMAARPAGTEMETGTGRACTLHFVAEDSVTDEYTLTLGAKFLLWGFPLALVILVVAETLLDTWWREPRR